MNIILEGPTGARVLSVTVPKVVTAPEVVTWQGRTYRWRGCLNDGVTYREATVLPLDGHMPGGGMTIHPDSDDERRWERA